MNQEHGKFAVARQELMENLQAYIRASAIPFLIMLAYALWQTPWRFSPVPPDVKINVQLDVLVGGIFFPVIVMSWFRYCRSGDMPPWLPLDWRGILRTYLAFIIQIAVAMGPVAIVAFGFLYVEGALSTGVVHASLTWSNGIPIALAFVWFLVTVVRLVGFVPEMASGQWISVREAWSLSRGHSTMILLTAVLFFFGSLAGTFVLLFPIESAALIRGWYAWPIMIWHQIVGWAFGGWMLLLWRQIVMLKAKAITP